jgi:methionyl aminopeptidase
MMINIRTANEIELIRESGRIVAGALDLAGRIITAGVSTEKINSELDSYIRNEGGKPEFLGFNGFPASICASINEEVVHGIPGPRRLRNGDIVGIDVGVRKDGYVADGARTFPVGGIPEHSERLVRVTKQALETAISMVSEGVHLSDISHAIQRKAEDEGYSIVRELAGHGVGTELHEPPEIPNYGEPGLGPVLKAGMILAIEPMINAGRPGVETLEDNWTVVTADRHRSAHFEHTVAVTRNGADILTRTPS